MTQADEQSTAGLPDLYQLLSLEPLEPDRRAIEQALKRIYARAKAAKGTDVKGASQSARIFQLGKQNLLSADRKKRYDQYWLRAFYEKSREDSSNVPGDVRELDKLLPKANPFEPFDLAEFLRATPSARDFESDFAELQIALAQMENGHSEPESVALEIAKPKSAQRSASLPSGGPTSVGERNPPSIARKLRRTGDKSIVWAASGLLASLATVLGILHFVLNAGEGGVAHPDNRSLSSQRNEAGGHVGEVAAVPRRGGLPSLQGFGATGDVSADVATSTGGVTEPLAKEPPITASTESVAPSEREREMPRMNATAAETNAMRPERSTTAEAPLTEEEKSIWLATMSGARNLLGQQQYAAASDNLEEAAILVKNEAQALQLARLSAVRQLAEEFRDALLQTLADLDAGETFTIGKSTEASLVEGTESHVSIRIDGKNQAFMLTEIPIGLAYGLVDLKMDIAHPTSKARKAAFALVHPGSVKNDLVLRRAKDMMSEAIAAGAVSQDMLSVFSDDYRL